MTSIIGALIVMGAVVGGFIFAGGKPAALFQIAEFIVIGGAALGSVLIANPPSMVMTTFKGMLEIFRGDPYKKDSYLELLRAIFELGQLARREGVLAIEHHIEHPDESDLFDRFPGLMGNAQAMEFLTDGMRSVIAGAAGKYELAEMLDTDIEGRRREEMKVTDILARLGDSMPGFGIVAAVLGVVITMGSIGGAPEEIGHHVAAALVGTFLGVLLAYGVFNPLAAASGSLVEGKTRYLEVIKIGIIGLQEGQNPRSCTEAARLSIDPGIRPTQRELEEHIASATARPAPGQAQEGLPKAA
jgi:chemotaxis protein MotA